MRGYRWLGIAVFVCAGCGGSDPPPDEVVVGDLVIRTDPLELSFDVPNGDFVVSNFIEVGTVDFLDENKYYDPRDLPDDSIIWTAATRATAWDEGAGILTLDNGVRMWAELRPGDAPPTVTLKVDADSVDNAVLIRLVLPRDPDEPIYGFGENFGSAEAGGSVREMQFRVDPDSESSLNETHVPVPLSLWPARGAGVFVEDPRPGAFDIGAARANNVLATYVLSADGPLAAHLFSADEPLALLRHYASITATPALPPMWAFAPQQWRNAHNSSQEAIDDADAMRAEGIPGSTMWIDNPWQTAYNDFTFDETRFDDPQGLLDYLASMGYRVLVWSTPYVNRDGLTADDFAEARSMDYLVRDDVGNPFVFPWQDGPGALVDFTTPGATEWYRERISRVVDMGVSGFKLDFGEDVVPELGGRLAPLQLTGGTAQTMHELYTEWYHDAYLGALPEGDGFLITRAGYYGEQRVNTCIWPGDLDNDFSLHGVDNGNGSRNVGGLPAAISAMLSLSASGYPFFGSDIGGFRNGVPTTEVLIRWSQYAALGTIMQLGGGGKSHNPWDTTLFDAPALDVYRTFSRLHMDLVPYIYSLAVVASRDGTPVTRPTRLVYPNAASDDATFLLGDAMFVAPVITEGATTRQVVLPEGRWTNWWTGELAVGDGTTSTVVQAPLDSMPIFRRNDHMVPVFARAADTLVPATAGGVTSYADSDYGRELRLLASPDGALAPLSLYDGTAAAGDVDATDYSFTVTAGSTFDIVTFDVGAGSASAPVADPASVSFDETPLLLLSTPTEVETCPSPGCWFWDAGRQRLLVRVHLADTSEHTVVIAGGS